MNFLLKLDYNNPKDKIMYLTLSPCEYCAKAIVKTNKLAINNLVNFISSSDELVVYLFKKVSSPHILSIL